MFQRNRSGFTLLELLVVLAIIALLVSIGVPRFARLFDRTADVFLASFVRELGELKMLAELGGEECAIKVYETEYKYFSIDNLTKAIGTRKFPASLKLDTDVSWARGMEIEFAASGSVTTVSKDSRTNKTVHPVEIPFVTSTGQKRKVLIDKTRGVFTLDK